MNFPLYRTFLPRLTAVLVLIVFSIIPIFGQGSRTELPDTPLGNNVREWLRVIASGNKEDIRHFVESRYSAAGRKNQPNAAEVFLKLHQQSGGLEIVRVTPAAGEFPMSILAKSKRGDHFARVMVMSDGSQKDKIGGIGVAKTFDPAAPKLGDIIRPIDDKELAEVIKKEVDRRAATGRFSGTVLVAKDDRILMQAAHGYADEANKLPVTVRTKFHLASVGKMFTAVAIAKLVQAGKLSYHDTVGKLLPDFPNSEIAKKVTIHHLLTHTSGMGTFFWSPGYDQNRVYRNAVDEISVYRDEKLVFEPGDRWRYSNAGYSLLGAIIERVSGKTYIEFIRENILKPAGMRDTDTNDPGQPAAGAAILYTQRPDDPLGIEEFAPNKKIRSSHATGFGDGSSNVLDLLKFARAYRMGKLLGPYVREELVSHKVTEPDGSQWGYGIKGRAIEGNLVRGHSGGGRTDVQMLWDSGYTVIVQTNKVPPTASSLCDEIVAFLAKQLNLRNKGKKA